MTEVQAQQLVTVIVTAFPSTMAKLDREQQRETMRTYRSLLADLDYDAANGAIRVLLQTRSWMPSVADIRSTVLELTRGPVASGAEAWGSVVKAIREQGVYRTPGVDFVFRDPVTARVVSAFSWEALCNSENSVADRARFIEAYEKIAAQDRKEQQAPQLAAARDVRELRNGEPRTLQSLLSKPEDLS